MPPLLCTGRCAPLSGGRGETVPQCHALATGTAAGTRYEVAAGRLPACRHRWTGTAHCDCRYTRATSVSDGTGRVVSTPRRRERRKARPAKPSPSGPSPLRVRPPVRDGSMCSAITRALPPGAGAGHRLRDPAASSRAFPPRRETRSRRPIESRQFDPMGFVGDARVSCDLHRSPARRRPDTPARKDRNPARWRNQSRAAGTSPALRGPP